MKKSLILGLLTLPIFTQAQQWIATGHEHIVNTVSITANNGTYYSPSMANGLYKSTNGGTTWSACGNVGLNPFSKQVKYVSVANDRLFIGTPGGTFYSTDQGDSWTKTGENMGLSLISYTREVSYFDSVYVAATTAGGKVFRSTDGISWRTSSDGLPLNAIVYTIKDLNAGFYAATNLGLYKSEDAGMTWTQESFPETTAIMDITNVGDQMLAITPSDGVFAKSNTGGTWSAINTDLPTGILGFFNHYDGALYLSLKLAGLYTSEDNGVTWTAFEAGISDADVSSCHQMVSGENEMVLATNGSLYYLSDGTVTNQPEISIEIDGQEYQSGDTAWFNAVSVGASSTVEFDIVNHGNGALNLTDHGDPIQVQGDWWPQFHIEQQGVDTVIDAGNITSFSISLIPLAEGDRFTTLSIRNNDLDESPFTLVLFGEGIGPSGLMEKATISQVKVYPNPSTGVFYVQELDVVSMRVYDSYGSSVAVVSSGLVDLTHAQPGMYFVRTLYADGEVKVGRLIKW